MTGGCEQGPSLPIGEATRRLLRARGLYAAVTLSEVLGAWHDVVGPQVALHARPVALHATVVTVEVDESAWATQLQLLSGSIVTGLSERLGDRAPTGVTIRVARPRPRHV